MLNRTLIYFTIVCAIGLLFTTCRKYPEGGWSNVAIKHLFGGNHDNSSKTWKLKLYEVNGIDSTSFITPGNGFTSFQNNEVVFKISMKRYKDYFINSKTFSLGVEFIDNKRKLNVGAAFEDQCINGICERDIFRPERDKHSFEWKIIKLTNNELILQGKFKSNYIIKSWI